MSDRPHVQFVMGVKNAMPAEEHLLDILLGELKRVLPKATWTAAGIGRHQSQVMRWVLERGGDGVRTGLEDNIRITKDRLASEQRRTGQGGCRSLRRIRRPPCHSRGSPVDAGLGGLRRAAGNAADGRRWRVWKTAPPALLLQEEQYDLGRNRE